MALTFEAGWSDLTTLRMSLTVVGEKVKVREGTRTSISALEAPKESKLATIGLRIGAKTCIRRILKCTWCIYVYMCVDTCVCVCVCPHVLYSVHYTYGGTA